MPTFYLIELFSGTGSFGKAASRVVQKLGYKPQVISVDSDPKCNATFCEDIMTWSYKADLLPILEAMRPRDILWVHASPPCTQYSMSNTQGVRRLEEADAIVLKTLRILKFLKPTYWTLENPVGLLQERPFMQKLNKHMNVTSYCKFGTRFRKRTVFWSNVPDLNLPICELGSYCKAKETFGFHEMRAQRGGKRPSHLAASDNYVYPTLDMLHTIPSRLTKHIISAALVIS